MSRFTALALTGGWVVFDLEVQLDRLGEVGDRPVVIALLLGRALQPRNTFSRGKP